MNTLNMLKLTGMALGVMLLLSGCDRVLSQERTVCITGYNEFGRGIHEFWLDSKEKSGCFGNPPGRDVNEIFGGGGKFACGCKIKPGKEVDLDWEMRLTWSEYEKGVMPKTYSKRVRIPEPESSSSRYLRVYFMKDGTTPLQWVDDMGAPELPPSDKRGK